LKKLLELRQQKAELHQQMKTLVETAESEKRSLSDDENTKFKALQTQIQDANSQIERAEVLADQERSIETGTITTKKADKPSNEELRTFVRTGESRSLSAGVNADGGFTVIPALDKTIYSLLRDNSVFRQNAMVQTISTEVYKKLVNIGGTAANWAAESDTRTETGTSSLKEIEISLNSLYSYPKTSQELLDWSGFDIAGWITSEVALESGEKEEAAFWNGDGVKKPKGLLTYTKAITDDATRAFGTIQEIESAATGVIDGDDLIDFVHTLRRGYRDSAKFYMTDATQAKIRKLKDTDGNYLWRAGIAEGEANTLLGKPVEIAEQLDDDYIVYGDLMRAYTVLDHASGVRLLRDNLTQPGFVKMFTTRYVGGGLIDSNAVKFLKAKAA
jgi:HK97 family phage major capsid protein